MEKEVKQANFYEKLANLCEELKAPKNQWNNFGKYNYRNAEDILEAVKPLCAQYGLRLKLTDGIEVIGDRVYVKATAIITDGTNVDEVTSYAREPLNKKGMDDSQVTGSAVSYARKYALGGLLLIDDTKDSDSQNNTQNNVKTTKKQVNKQVSQPVANNNGKIDSAQLVFINKMIERVAKLSSQTPEVITNGLKQKLEFDGELKDLESSKNEKAVQLLTAWGKQFSKQTTEVDWGR